MAESKTILAREKYRIISENPTNGELETNWFVNDGNNETQEKIRVVVEPGFQDQSAEVSLVHISMPQKYRAK